MEINDTTLALHSHDPGFNSQYFKKSTIPFFIYRRKFRAIASRSLIECHILFLNTLCFNLFLGGTFHLQIYLYLWYWL